MSGDTGSSRWVNLLEKAKSFKEAGNKAFKERNFKEAKKNYHYCILNAKAVLHIPFNADGKAKHPLSLAGLDSGGTNCGTTSASEEGSSSGVCVPLHPLAQQGKELTTLCYNNLAACIVQTAKDCEPRDFSRGIEYCDKVLQEMPKNTKALSRKGRCLFHLREYNRAIEAFQLCQDIAEDPDNNMMIDKCRRLLAAYDKKSRQELLGMFDRGKDKKGAATTSEDTVNESEQHQNGPIQEDTLSSEMNVDDAQAPPVDAEK